MIVRRVVGGPTSSACRCRAERWRRSRTRRGPSHPSTTPRWRSRRPWPGRDRAQTEVARKVPGAGIHSVTSCRAPAKLWGDGSVVGDVRAPAGGGECNMARDNGYEVCCEATKQSCSVPARVGRSPDPPWSKGPDASAPLPGRTERTPSSNAPLRWRTLGRTAN